MTCVWPGVATWAARAPEPHAPRKLSHLVVLLLLPCLPLSLLLFYISAQLLTSDREKQKVTVRIREENAGEEEGHDCQCACRGGESVSCARRRWALGVDIGKNPTCSDTPDGAEAAQVHLVSFVFSRFAYLRVLVSLMY